MVPGCAHPGMKMHAASGYILFGIKTLTNSTFSLSSLPPTEKRNVVLNASPSVRERHQTKKRKKTEMK